MPNLLLADLLKTSPPPEICNRLLHSETQMRFARDSFVCNF
jgi:hypothetical protein